MPITGQESALSSQLQSDITAAIEAEYGAPIRNPEYIQALCDGIANALIPFLVTNTQVNTGQSVVVPGAGLIDSSTSAAISGIATGTVDTTGTIS